VESSDLGALKTGTRRLLSTSPQQGLPSRSRSCSRQSSRRESPSARRLRASSRLTGRAALRYLRTSRQRMPRVATAATPRTARCPSLLATHGRQDILVDLCGASFIDSSVINTLLRSARAHVGSVELVGGHCSFPHRVLGLARIQQVVRIQRGLGRRACGHGCPAGRPDGPARVRIRRVCPEDGRLTSCGVVRACARVGASLLREPRRQGGAARATGVRILGPAAPRRRAGSGAMPVRSRPSPRAGARQPRMRRRALPKHRGFAKNPQIARFRQL
jgi:hypothetical protein